MYGAATGLLLGGVTALVVDSNDRGDAIRWGIVLGTFGGFAYGVYKVSTNDDDMFYREPGKDRFGDLSAARNHLHLAELSRPPLSQAVDWTVASRPPVSYVGPWKMVTEGSTERVTTAPRLGAGGPDAHGPTE